MLPLDSVPFAAGVAVSGHPPRPASTATADVGPCSELLRGSVDCGLVYMVFEVLVVGVFPSPPAKAVGISLASELRTMNMWPALSSLLFLLSGDAAGGGDACAVDSSPSREAREARLLARSLLAGTCMPCVLSLLSLESPSLSHGDTVVAAALGSRVLTSGQEDQE